MAERKPTLGDCSRRLSKKQQSWSSEIKQNRLSRGGKQRNNENAGEKAKTGWQQEVKQERAELEQQNRSSRSGKRNNVNGGKKAKAG
jgi:hypothetical protein